MKIFQIFNGVCHWHTPYKTLEEAQNRYPPSVQFVEAPDYVFEGWGYLDGEFIKPTAPESFIYDDATGTFYHESGEPPPPPHTLEERFSALEAGNTSLTAKLNASIQSNQFLEECIVEMAQILYA